MWPFDQLFGNGSSSTPDAPSDPTTNPTVQAWVQAHGAIVGKPYVTDPTLANGGQNPNPTYDIVFSDGSHMTMDASGAVKDAVQTGQTKAQSPYDHYYQAADGTEHGIKADGTDVVLNSTTKPASTAPAPISAPANEQNILLRDPQTGKLTAVANPNYVAPADASKTVAVGSKVYEKQPDGSYKVVIDGSAAPKVIGGGSANDQYLILQGADGTTSQITNPNYVAPKPQVVGGVSTSDQYILTQNTDGTTTRTPNPNYQPPKPQVIGGGNTTDQYITQQQPDGSIKQVPNPNYVAPKPTVVSTNTDSPTITTMDADGTLHTQANPGYAAPKPTSLPADRTAPYLLAYVPDGKGGYTIQQTANPNQATVSDAILGLYQSLSPLVQGQQMPLDTAKDLLTAASTRMNQDLTARGQDVTAQGNAEQYATSVAGDAARMAQDANSFAVAPGTNAYVQSQQNGGNAPAPGPLTQLPYDPATFAANQAAAALAHISPAAMAHHQAVTAGLPPPASPAQQPAFQAPGSGAAGGGPLGTGPQTPAMIGANGGSPTAAAQTIAGLPPFQAPTGGSSGHQITINIGGAGDGSTPPPGWEHNQTAPTQTPAPDPLHPPVISQSGSMFPPFQAPQAA